MWLGKQELESMLSGRQLLPPCFWGSLGSAENRHGGMRGPGHLSLMGAPCSHPGATPPGLGILLWSQTRALRQLVLTMAFVRWRQVRITAGMAGAGFAVLMWVLDAS